MAEVSAMPDTQQEEFDLAKEEARQPRCIYCGELLNTVRETQTVDILWTWNPDTKSYDKNDTGGDSDTPYCGNCEAKDWDFSNNGTIEY